MKTPFKYIADLTKQISEIPPGSIVSQTIHDDEQVRAVLFAFAPGQELSEHTASRAATLYFVQGEADITLGDEAKIAQAGTWVHMTPHLPHSIVAKTAVLMLLTMFKVGPSGQ